MIKIFVFILMVLVMGMVSVASADVQRIALFVQSATIEPGKEKPLHAVCLDKYSAIPGNNTSFQMVNSLGQASIVVGNGKPVPLDQVLKENANITITGTTDQNGENRYDEVMFKNGTSQAVQIIIDKPLVLTPDQSLPVIDLIETYAEYSKNLTTECSQDQDCIIESQTEIWRQQIIEINKSLTINESIENMKKELISYTTENTFSGTNEIIQYQLNTAMIIDKHLYWLSQLEDFYDDEGGIQSIYLRQTMANRLNTSDNANEHVIIERKMINNSIVYIIYDGVKRPIAVNDNEGLGQYFYDWSQNASKTNKHLHFIGDGENTHFTSALATILFADPDAIDNVSEVSIAKKLISLDILQEKHTDKKYAKVNDKITVLYNGKNLSHFKYPGADVMMYTKTTKLKQIWKGAFDSLFGKIKTTEELHRAAEQIKSTIEIITRETYENDREVYNEETKDGYSTPYVFVDIFDTSGWAERVIIETGHIIVVRLAVDTMIAMSHPYHHGEE